MPILGTAGAASARGFGLTNGIPFNHAASFWTSLNGVTLTTSGYNRLNNIYACFTDNTSSSVGTNSIFVAKISGQNGEMSGSYYKQYTINAGNYWRITAVEETTSYILISLLLNDVPFTANKSAFLSLNKNNINTSSSAINAKSQNGISSAGKLLAYSDTVAWYISGQYVYTVNPSTANVGNVRFLSAKTADNIISDGTNLFVQCGNYSSGTSIVSFSNDLTTVNWSGDFYIGTGTRYSLGIAYDSTNGYIFAVSYLYNNVTKHAIIAKIPSSGTGTVDIRFVMPSAFTYSPDGPVCSDGIYLYVTGYEASTGIAIIKIDMSQSTFPVVDAIYIQSSGASLGLSSIKMQGSNSLVITTLIAGQISLSTNLSSEIGTYSATVGSAPSSITISAATITTSTSTTSKSSSISTTLTSMSNTTQTATETSVAVQSASTRIPLK